MLIMYIGLCIGYSVTMIVCYIFFLNLKKIFNNDFMSIIYFNTCAWFGYTIVSGEGGGTEYFAWSVSESL